MEAVISIIAWCFSPVNHRNVSISIWIAHILKHHYQTFMYVDVDLSSGLDVLTLLRKRCEYAQIQMYKFRWLKYRQVYTVHPVEMSTKLILFRLYTGGNVISVLLTESFKSFSSELDLY